MKMKMERGSMRVFHASILDQVLPKPSPPRRINPPSDQITKKKSAEFNKFEEMLAKGFETFNSFVKPPAASKIKTQNEAFCDYLLTEDIPKEHQSTVRRKLIIHLHTLKEEHNSDPH
ncbi:hypothetical protein JTB14_022400 [Gonioctena quinquepunctata]|nr:hypothetical protein JTB14_022400 [Gonioctena quinquepunctata]